MYSGPGPGPLLAAAEAWDGLAAELSLASTGYGSTIAELTGGPWIGPTSVTMLSAVAPYINWLSTTAAQAEETANQARAAVAAYEAAFAMTVPPPVIEANRALLMALIATNFFGQNKRPSWPPRPSTPKWVPKTPRPCTATPAPQQPPPR